MESKLRSFIRLSHLFALLEVDDGWHLLINRIFQLVLCYRLQLLRNRCVRLQTWYLLSSYCGRQFHANATSTSSRASTDWSKIKLHLSMISTGLIQFNYTTFIRQNWCHAHTSINFCLNIVINFYLSHFPSSPSTPTLMKAYSPLLILFTTRFSIRSPQLHHYSSIVTASSFSQRKGEIWSAWTRSLYQIDCTDNQQCCNNYCLFYY